MKFLNRIKLARKLPVFMVGLTAIAILISSIVSYQAASKSLLVEAESKLSVVADARTTQLTDFLDSIHVDIESQAANPTVGSAVRGFGEAWRAIAEDPQGYLQKWYIEDNSFAQGEKLNLDFAEDGSAYSQVHKLYHPYFRSLVEQRGYYDVFIVNEGGDIVYSVFKEMDFATNINDGIVDGTGLQSVITAALAATEPTVVFADFQSYAPSYGAPASFIASPIIDRRGNVKGAIAFQMPISRMDAIMNSPDGLGETGEALLFGTDYTTRTSLRLDPEAKPLETPVKGPATEAALRGERGMVTALIPRAGTQAEVLIFHRPLQFEGISMGVLVSQEVNEIIAPAKALAFKMMWQGGLMILGVGIIGYLIARSVSRPLTLVERAMRTVSQGDYGISVEGIERQDEIGGIAKALDDFRGALSRAQQATRDGLFKGAAFEGSSAALMMINTDFEVIYMNSAASALMKAHDTSFRQTVPSFDAEKIVGQTIDIFYKNPKEIRQTLSDPAKLPFYTDMKVGETYLALDVNAVVDLEGQQIGCVMEWKDVTEMRKNAAIIEALDANQAKAEFSLDGKLLVANENFCKLAGATSEELVGRDHDHLFAFDPALAAKRGAVWDRVTAGESVYGRFNLTDGAGATSIIDGAFSPVKEQGGKPFRVILLGNDITQSQQALRDGEVRREEMQAAQQSVVDALRVGLKKLADGDLTSKIETVFAQDYETLRADFNLAMENLLNAMSSVVENADMIRGEASEISNAADDLSRRTEKQAATLEETATALDQLTSSVRSAADGANQASEMVASAKSNAEASGKVVEEAVRAMSEIESSSEQISKITSVIDDIAFQTNLLALNAGVEAARAGEAGRGFAVVASEVRALAQRSSDAAREINDLISQSGTHVKRGVSLVGDTGEALRGIVVSVSEIANHVAEIAVSSREQSSGLAEINIAVNQLDQVTQQNAAMFEETTAASHSLTREAETLTVTMARFTIDSGRRQAAARAPATPPAQTRAAVTAPVVKQAVNAPEMPGAASDGGWEDF
ncbi:Methyl-accepting chemotaxis protein I [Aquimixticola soesokkakensis]|uniref:Methyl-accepting chemotaxis protein I n=1 Tax=Aquimixticola soesokkakensis TaxID=1519096 RepID=A0A1Y5T7Z9_9RHOB|nr:methyl-accepting chemotaxis protein [Aquimixticola soesokkakensis]SLN57834.1 Methyl-accepting chemotaxis protein I [Aquimixticola soesokkakensis]